MSIPLMEYNAETLSKVKLQPLVKCKAIIEYQSRKRRATVWTYAYVVDHLPCGIPVILGNDANKPAGIWINFFTGELNRVRQNPDINYMHLKEDFELIYITCAYVPKTLTHNHEVPKKVLIFTDDSTYNRTDVSLLNAMIAVKIAITNFFSKNIRQKRNCSGNIWRYKI